ncbi:MAG TPA: M48 family metallopeptidase [Phycisphaerales bacterium]|nr:M48 family metallopeptidase [Phycisphaerales bacterium]
MAFALGRRGRGRGIGLSPRIIIAVVIALVSVVGYFGNRALNPVTGRKQSLALTADQEVALGLQAAPEMAAQFGGLSRSAEGTRLVKDVGFEILQAVGDAAGTYRFDFHLLADPKTVNAFALPGGQIFITEALLTRLETRGQLAGVLGHEAGHVLARHSSEQMAKAKLTQGLTGAAVVGASDSRGGGYTAAAVASFVGQFALLKYSREHELESDRLGVRFMVKAGYDPRAMIEVMRILEQASGGPSNRPEFSQTHPNPGNRIKEIERAIAEEFPEGVPEGLQK